MSNDYTREEIIEKLETYLDAEGFKCQKYSKRLGDIRLPLYCKRSQEDNSVEEIVIDIITESTVSKKLYLPTIPIQSTTIESACAPRFFQYYLPKVKIFWAYGYYVIKNNKYKRFKTACAKNGIGLLEVSDSGVTVKLDAKPLSEQASEQMRTQVENNIEECSQKEQLIKNLSDYICEEQEDYIHYLVYYGAPQFQRRAITNRGTQDLSLLLVNRLVEINNIKYKRDLQRLATKYRNADKVDYEIALKTIQELWASRLNADYPEIQKDFEVVLRLDPKYRDHFLHQFQVFLLGAIIIDKLYDTQPIRAFEQSTGSPIEDAWLAASTYHDFNYPVERCEDWMNSFFQQNLHVDSKEIARLSLEKVVVTDYFLSKIQNLCSVIGYAADDCFMRFILERAAIDRNHAVLGALTFLKKFQTNNRLTTDAVNHAAASIFMHDFRNWRCFCGKGDCEDLKDWEINLFNKSPLPNLTFDSFPLLFLLAFCDEAQEWGRVGADYEETIPELEDIEVDHKKILIHISVKNDQSLNKKHGKIQKLKRFLKDRRFGIKIYSPTGGSAEEWMTGE